MRRSEVAICKWMHWSYGELLAAPKSVVETVADVMAEYSAAMDLDI